MRRSVPIETTETAREVLGPRDDHLRRVREAFDVRAVLRGGRIAIEGDAANVARAAAAFEEMRRVVDALGRITRDEVDRVIAGAGGRDPLRQHEGDAAKESIAVGRGRSIGARTPGQELYMRTMRAHDIVFCVGPAGTGKTYLAVAMALSDLEAGRVRRIVLARPAVEAGERLGFLPGDMREKVNPYLRPLYDSLQDMLSYSALARLIEQGVVEVVPLAYMRGRTLGHAFVILDEAQNTTTAQMLMFLTRLGLEARAVVTGDVTQIDLPDPARSGLVQACRILGGIEEIGMVHLSEQDIVRHRLVRRIVEAYETDRVAKAAEAARREGTPAGGGGRQEADG